jgi:hypothetical protein
MEGRQVIDVRIKFVVEDVDRHGNVRIYFRRKGHPKVRLPGPIGSGDFWTVYRATLAGEARKTSVRHAANHKKTVLGGCAKLITARPSSSRFPHVRKLSAEELSICSVRKTAISPTLD